MTRLSHPIVGLLALAAGLVSAGCAAVAAGTTTQIVAEPAGRDAEAWRPFDPEDVLLVETPSGVVAIALATRFAPAHAAQMRALARSGHFEGATFYRFVEGFVAQGGVYDDALEDPYDDGAPTLTSEFERPINAAGDFVPLGSLDVFAAEVGHVDAFQAARDTGLGTTWLTHCPGAVAMARDDDPDTGSSHFYVVVGQSPRYLDRNLTVFGRVIDGYEHILRLKRGDPEVERGVIQSPEGRDPILSVRVLADEPETKRARFEYMAPLTAAFSEHKRTRRERTVPFFVNPPPQVLDVCATPVPVRRLAP